MTTSAPEPVQKHDAYLAFRYPQFRLFAVGYVLAVLSSQIFATTVQWDIFQRTGSKLALGVIGLMGAIPNLLLALPAGHVADSLPRKRVLIVTQAILSVIPMIVAQTRWWGNGWQRSEVVFALVALNAVTLTFARPARGSLMSNLVPRDSFLNVSTWVSSMFEMASWIGPAICGIILASSSKYGLDYAYVAAASFMLICLIVTLPLRPNVSYRVREPISVASLLSGVHFVFSNPLLWGSMLLDLLAVLLGGATYLLPVFAERLGTGPVGYGALRGAPALGAACMAVLQAHLPPYRKAGRALFLAVAAYGCATIVFGLSQNLYLSLAMLFLVGVADNVSVVIRHTLVQTLTPDSMRGRVAAVNQVFIGASNELGGFESGVTAHWLGPVVSVVSGGIGAILVVLGIGYTAKPLRELGRLTDLPGPVETADSPSGQSSKTET